MENITISLNEVILENLDHLIPNKRLLNNECMQTNSLSSV